MSRVYGASLYVLSALWGVAQILLPDDGGVYFVFALLLATASTLWARQDAIARGKPIPQAILALYFWVWPLGATVYLVGRSGWRGFATAVLHGLGMAVVLVVVFYATFLSLYAVGLVKAPA